MHFYYIMISNVPTPANTFIYKANTRECQFCNKSMLHSSLSKHKRSCRKNPSFSKNLEREILPSQTKCKFCFKVLCKESLGRHLRSCKPHKLLTSEDLITDMSSIDDRELRLKMQSSLDPENIRNEFINRARTKQINSYKCHLCGRRYLNSSYLNIHLKFCSLDNKLTICTEAQWTIEGKMDRFSVSALIQYAMDNQMIDFAQKLLILSRGLQHRQAMRKSTITCEQ